MGSGKKKKKKRSLVTFCPVSLLVNGDYSKYRKFRGLPKVMSKYKGLFVKKYI